jgi:hypothetical protein
MTGSISRNGSVFRPGSTLARKAESAPGLGGWRRRRGRGQAPRRRRTVNTVSVTRSGMEARGWTRVRRWAFPATRHTHAGEGECRGNGN